MKPEVKVGIFFAVVLFLLAMFVFIVGDMSVLFKKPGYDIVSYFDSTAGLEKKAVVRLAGVKVGHVKDIRLKGTRAEVVMTIERRVNIPSDSRATIASLGFVGEKFIEISPGKVNEYCQPGATLESRPSLSMDQIGNQLLSIGEDVREMSRALLEMVGTEESKDNFKNILHNFSSFTSELEEFLRTNRDKLDQAIGDSAQAAQNLNQKVQQVAENMDELVSLLKEIAQENREEIKVNLQGIKEMIQNTEKAIQSLSETLEKINKGEGTLGKLVQKHDLYDDAEKTVRQARQVLQPLSSLRMELGFRSDYYPGDDLVKSYLSFSFWPTSERFLFAQIVRDPWKEKFTYSAQGGLRWGNLSPRAGIIESSFGVGVDYYLARDRIKFSAESYDFNRDPGPRFRLLTRYAPHRYFYMVMGIDDFTLASNRKIFFGLGLGYQ